MSRTQPSRVLGIDGCSNGWAGIVWDGEGATGVHSRTLRGLVDAALAGGRLQVVVVDMPLGLADEGVRRADLEARQALGAKSSSIFMTPVRAAVLRRAGRRRARSTASAAAVA